MEALYRDLKRKARTCRDRDIRIKVELVCLALKLGNVAEACRRMGFNRKFYYRWWKRLKRADFELWGLEEKSRRPRKSPGKLSWKTERAIQWYARHDYGSRMIEGYLDREGKAPARSTICHVLNKRRPPTKNKRERLKKHRKRYELPIPGQRFQLDVKYVPELVGGKKAYNYVIVDECTRWRYAYAFDSLCAGTTVEFLERFKRVCPFPIHCIQTDHGQEFTYRLNPIAQHLEHPMDEWCKFHGITHRLIPPGVKELNGKVERSHRIDEHYFFWHAPASSLAAFNAALDKWIYKYNHQRIHGGIGFLTPVEKLRERYGALKNEALPVELEKLRFKFLQSEPKRWQTKDEQLDQLDQQLRNLIKLAA